MQPYDPDTDTMLNPGIIKTVKLLRELGYDTRDSGDGVTGHCECDVPYPYVHILVEERNDLIMLSLKLRNELEQRLGKEIWKDERVYKDGDGVFTAAPTVEASYCPIDNIATITVLGLGDADFFSGSGLN